MNLSIRRTLMGAPLPTAASVHERLSKVQALAVLSSDALSSVAYATEEILLVLVLAGSGALGLSTPIAFSIGVLLIIVAISYYQTVHAYPTGGGAYTVARENLGTLPSLIAGGALLSDYVLTVAVSVSAGVAAVVSALPGLAHLRVELALLAIAFISLMNLRGVRESGRIFAVPTYFFIGSMALLIVTGLVQVVLGRLDPLDVEPLLENEAAQSLTLFLILRAFASGCTAMTGVEAISNGVAIFRRPEADNAGRTMLWMAGILTAMFLGTTFLGHQLGIVPSHHETVISQIGRAIFGGGVFYYALQAGTAMILLLAANTSYSDFPRLAMWMAKDGYLPRQLMNVGDRLVYNNGILLLGTLAGLLVIGFGATTHALVPLYAVGVFISFTLNQSGMVCHWLKLRTPGWQRSALINGVGAVSTGLVLVVVATSKFVYGAWIVLLLIPLLVLLFQAIHRHYADVAAELSMDKGGPTPIRRHTVIVPVAGLHRGVVKAVRYAQVLGGDLHVVSVAIDEESARALAGRWAERMPDVPLEFVESPYRAVVEPLLAYIDSFIEQEGDFATVVIPEFVPTKWWHHLLHNETALALKFGILYSRDNWKGRFHVITDVPFYLKR